MTDLAEVKSFAKVTFFYFLLILRKIKHCLFLQAQKVILALKYHLFI